MSGRVRLFTVIFLLRTFWRLSPRPDELTDPSGKEDVAVVWQTESVGSAVGRSPCRGGPEGRRHERGRGSPQVQHGHAAVRDGHVSASLGGKQRGSQEHQGNCARAPASIQDRGTKTQRETEFRKGWGWFTPNRSTETAECSWTFKRRPASSMVAV